MLNDKYEILQKIPARQMVKHFKSSFGLDVTEYFSGIDVLEYREHLKSGVKYFYPLVTGDEIFYEQLQKFDWYYQKNKDEYDFASSFTKNKNVLEVGCGSGWFYDIAGAVNYTGLEYNNRAIKQCQEKGITVFKHSIEDHKRKYKKVYEVVCAFQVLEHVSDPFEFISSALGCLEPNGLLVISVPSDDSFVGLARNSILNMPPHHVTHWPDRSFDYIAKEFGVVLERVHHHKLDPIHYDWFTSVTARERVRRFLRIESNSLFDVTVSDKLLSRLGSALGAVLKFSTKKSRLLARGHTVTAVFRNIV